MAKKLNAIILDDEEDAVRLLQLQLEKHCPEIEYISTFTSPVDALEFIAINAPDVLFLDIDMPVLNGFEVLEKLIPFKFAVIFVTAFNHYAIKAFKFNAIDYLLKPCDTGDLKDAVKRISESGKLNYATIDTLKKQIKGDLISKIAIPTQNGISFIELDEIIYVESNNNYCKLFLTNNRTLMLAKTLKEVFEVLELSHFFRVHRQYIINLKLVKHLSKTDLLLTMSNNTELPISRTQKEKLLAQYNAF